MDNLTPKEQKYLDRVSAMSPVDRYVQWVQERHQIFLKKRNGLPKPWTNDPIMRRFFFTTPYRENDKVTVWFRENLREGLRDDPRIIFTTIAFRWFNYIPTCEVLIGSGKETNLLLEWDTEMAIKHLQSIEGKVFTGAFMICNAASNMPKINAVCEKYVQPAWEQRHDFIEEFGTLQHDGFLTMQKAHKLLMQLPGLGGFMAYEVVCDLRYTMFLENAPDKMTWCNPGPGAKRGLNRILGRPINAAIPDWDEQVQRLLRILQQRLPHMPLFEMREVEHVLCEVDKWERARLNQGHMKRRYNGQ